MKKLKLWKIATGLLMAASVSALNPIGASAQWKQDSNGWWNEEGNSWSVGWRYIDGEWYYFDSNGYMKTGWIQYEDRWYYLYSNGVMARNTTINGYVLDYNGVWIQSSKNNLAASKGNNAVNSNDIASNNNNFNSNSMINEDIEKAVGQAIISKGQEAYLNGERATEGHIILETEEKDNVVKVYTISSFGYFGFENNIFAKISGSGAIPTVMTFSKNRDNRYSLIEYKEPEDGEGCIDSIKKMFPERLWNKVLANDDTSYSKLAASQENQAKEYLKGIGRAAQVNAGYVERQLPNIDVSAENKLFAYCGKNDSFLNNCPYWLGTKEEIKDGVRLIYETSQSKSNDGYDLITFKETKADGTVVEERTYKIVGSEPELQ